MRLAVDVEKSTGSLPVSAECSWTRSRRQRPGRHLVTGNIRGQLVQHGIQPCAAGNAAMFQLAAEMPSAVLADILGRSPSTAARWAALSAHDWAQYTAQRATPPDQ